MRQTEITPGFAAALMLVHRHNEQIYEEEMNRDMQDPAVQQAHVCSLEQEAKSRRDQSVDMEADYRELIRCDSDELGALVHLVHIADGSLGQTHKRISEIMRRYPGLICPETNTMEEAVEALENYVDEMGTCQKGMEILRHEE
jgi:hypothetical protein